MALDKNAVDEAAKRYWISLFDSYGETFVKDVPRKIKAALIANKRIASKTAEPKPNQVMPMAHAKLATGGLRLEGIYKVTGNKSLAFVADFTKDGTVQDISSVVLG